MATLPPISIAADHIGENLRLPEKWLRVATADVASAGESIAAIHQSFRGQLHPSHRHTQSVRVHNVECGPFGVSMWRYGGELKVESEDLGSSLVPITMLQGRSSLETAGRTIDRTPGTTVLASADDRPRFHYGADSEVLKLRFDLGRLEALCWRLLGREGRMPLRFDMLMDDAAQARRWMLLLEYLVGTLDGSPVDVRHARLAPNIEELLMLHLLTRQPNNYTDALHADPVKIFPSQCRRAIAYIEQHFDQPITLAEIAMVAGCSIRSLSRAFAQFVGNTPMRYVQNLRLERARADLQGPHDARETILDVAMRRGFNHQGEFNRRYRSRFGETPSQTRRRAY
jgi:AraC-like DNA-binding protein